MATDEPRGLTGAQHSGSLAFHSVSRGTAAGVLLDRLQFEFPAGSFVTLLGRARAGKTSVLRLIAGLDHPTSGRVLVGSEAPRPERVAFVYQQFVNYPSLTVYENIASPLRIARSPDVDAKVRETAALLRLEPFLKRVPAELSGGQQQRTAIARALVKDAAVLLLDEPLANLDYKLREELRAELQGIFARRKATVVYATAEPHEALLLGGWTVVLHEGRVLELGKAPDVYRSPGSLEAARVFSDPPLNEFPVEVKGGVAAANLHPAEPPALPIPLPPGLALADGRYVFAIRAHHLSLSAGSPQDVRLPVTVELAEVSGSSTILHARHETSRLSDARSPHVWIAEQQDVFAPRAPGERLDLFLDPRRLLAFHPDGKRAHGATPAFSPNPHVGTSHGPN